MAPGAVALSDPVDVAVDAESVVTVSLYLSSGQAGHAITSHPGSRVTSYFAPGNLVDHDDIVDAAASSVEHWYFISALEAYLPLQEPPTSALFVVGDSITDGRGSTTNANNRWPDVLLARMQNASSPLVSGIAVVNQAAGGNRVLHDGLGPGALARLDRDVLAQSPGSYPSAPHLPKYAFIFEGVNDLGTADATAAAQDAVVAQLVSAYEQMIARLHRFGVPVFGATITPFTGPGQAYGEPTREAARQRLNAWVRDSRRFDAVVDFDAVVRDEARPDRLRPAYDSGDHLHLNPDGYRALGQAVDLGLFEQFADGVESMV